MKTENGYYIWNKGESGSLSPHFGLHEFTCQCNLAECIENKISVELIEKLEDLRDRVGSPLKITSGYRCEAHQQELSDGGLETAKNSQHCLGNAADVACGHMDALKAQAPHLFLCIGFANSFCHLDLRKDKARTWFYSKSY